MSAAPGGPGPPGDAGPEDLLRGLAPRLTTGVPERRYPRGRADPPPGPAAK